MQSLMHHCRIVSPSSPRELQNEKAGRKIFNFTSDLQLHYKDYKDYKGTRITNYYLLVTL